MRFYFVNSFEIPNFASCYGNQVFNTEILIFPSKLRRCGRGVVLVEENLKNS